MNVLVLIASTYIFIFICVDRAAAAELIKSKA